MAQPGPKARHPRALLAVAGAEHVVLYMYCRCIPLWPGLAPNETDVPKTPPETRTPDDGNGCGPGRDAPCDHVRDVSVPTLTPFLVSNGTGAAIIIAPGGGYHDLAFGKEGIDVAHMCTNLLLTTTNGTPFARQAPEDVPPTTFAR